MRKANSHSDIRNADEGTAITGGGREENGDVLRLLGFAPLTLKPTGAQVYDPSGLIAFAYDARGRLVQKTSTINSINYPVTYSYTLGGKVGSVTYPGGRVTTYGRNAFGKISELTASGIATPLASGLTYKPFGGPTGLTNGFGER